MCCMRAFCLLVSYSRWLSKKKNRIGESRWNCTTRRLSKAMLSQRVRFTTLDVAAMADDDTTPIALRKWLLRSSDNTTRLKSTTKSALLRRLVAFICAAGLAWHLCTFENAADLRFFGGIGLGPATPMRTKTPESRSPLASKSRLVGESIAFRRRAISTDRC